LPIRPPHRPVRAQFTHTVPQAESLLPAAVHWRAGVRVGELEVSPLVPARGTLCSTSPSLPWVPWASVPHLHRYYATLRLPPCPSRVASLVARFPIPCALLSFVVSPQGSLPGRSAQTAPGPLVTRSPIPGISSRRQVALPSSRVPPVKTCPALRPRWCPAHSPLSHTGLLPSGACKPSALTSIPLRRSF
jgi:hypothetical protein